MANGPNPGFPLPAAGVTIVGRFDQFDVYGGEGEIISSSAQAADGQAISQLQVLEMDVNGRLVPWDASGEHSSGTLTFTGQPVAAETLAINGVSIEVVASGATGAQFNLGTADTDTVANLVALINGVPDSTDPNTLLPVYGTLPLAGTGVTATVDATGLIITLHAIAEGDAGNAVTLTESMSNVSASGATLTGADSSQAQGIVTFTATATATQTVSINGQAVTFETTGATGTDQINIGASATDSAQNLKALINANPSIYGVTAEGIGATLVLTAIEEGAAGNLIALAHSNTNPTISAATLTGGGAAEEVPVKPIGIAAMAVAAATPGSFLPYFTGGVFNHEALVWPAGVATLAQRQRAFAGSDIGVRQLL